MPLSKIQSVMTPNTGSMRKNLIMNGNFIVNQRVPGGSNTGVNTDNYHMHDRWKLFNNQATFTVSDNIIGVNDAPYTHGHRHTHKLSVTTKQDSPASGDRMKLYQGIEGKNLQHLQYGTSGAKSVTVSFWVYATQTGTNNVLLYASPSSGSARQQGKQYTINQSNTWEFKQLTFTGDTLSTQIIPNDETMGLSLQFMLGGGTGYTQGSLSNTWTAANSNNEMPNQTNHAGADGNQFLLTGIQMEIGDAATDFEHENFSDELRRCKRYFQYVHIMQDYMDYGTVMASIMYRGFKYEEPPRITPQFAVTDTLKYYTGGSAANFPSPFPAGFGITDKHKNHLEITQTGFSNGRGYLDGTISVFADF